MDGRALDPGELGILADHVVDRSRRQVAVRVLQQGTLREHTSQLG